MSHEYEAQRMAESAARWRVLAWIITILGAVAVLWLSIADARRAAYDDWYGYQEGFRAGDFFLNLLVFGVLLLVTVAPLFLTGHVMVGLSQVMRGARSEAWARAKASNWRVLTWVLTVLGLVAAILLAAGVARVGNALGAETSDSATAGFVVFLFVALVWMLQIWPLFMLCRTMDGVGVLLGDGGGLSSLPTTLPTITRISERHHERSDQMSGLPPPAPAPVPTAWSVSHRVPQGGLPARRRPDPNLPILMRIRGGVELRMVERRADWALVETDQGWQAWVDGRRLEEAGAASSTTQPPAEPPAPPDENQ